MWLRSRNGRTLGHESTHAVRAVRYACHAANGARHPTERCSLLTTRRTFRDVRVETAVDAERVATNRTLKRCGRLLGESRPRANPVWGRGGVGT